VALALGVGVQFIITAVGIQEYDGVCTNIRARQLSIQWQNIHNASKSTNERTDVNNKIVKTLNAPPTNVMPPTIS